MKTLLLSGLALTIGMSLYAAPTEPVILDYVYATHISPNGRYVGFLGADCSIYDVESGELTFYDSGSLGLGNAVSNVGLSVGDQHDQTVVMKDGVIRVPESFRPYWMSAANGVTTDGTRMVGYVNNPKMDPGSLDFTDSKEPGIIPFYCDIDENGVAGEVNILPYPMTDMFGAVPQYIVALWISEDGRTIAGQVVHNSGRSADPIVFTQGDDGSWTYDMPSKDLFNPDHIELPENPWKNMPPAPDILDYMDEENRELYIEALDAYLSGQSPIEPDPFEFMTPEQGDEFIAAAEEYLTYEDNHRAEFQAYDKAYKEILQTSPLFSNNDLALNPQGTKLLATSTVATATGDDNLVIYEFDLANNTNRKLESKYYNIYPRQILSDGTIIGETGMISVSQSYIWLPDQPDFMTIYDYFTQTNPSFAEWMEKTIPTASGMVEASDDLTVFSGGIVFLHLAVEPAEDIIWQSYIFTDALTFAGVDEIAAEQPGSYDAPKAIYNLQGVKMNAASVNDLPKGLYIIDGKKVMVK